LVFGRYVLQQIFFFGNISLSMYPAFSPKYRAPPLVISVLTKRDLRSQHLNLHSVGIMNAYI